MLKISSTRLHVLSRPLLKLGSALFCGNFSRVFSSATFNSETVFGFGWSFQKTSWIASQTWYLQGVQICRVTWPLFLPNQFACRHCWVIRAVCAEPHACLSHRSLTMFSALAAVCTVDCAIEIILIILHYIHYMSLNLPLHPAVVGCSLQ